MKIKRKGRKRRAIERSTKTEKESEGKQKRDLRERKLMATVKRKAGTEK